jgi:hypothetical protein
MNWWYELLCLIISVVILCVGVGILFVNEDKIWLFWGLVMTIIGGLLTLIIGYKLIPKLNE